MTAQPELAPGVEETVVASVAARGLEISWCRSSPQIRRYSIERLEHRFCRACGRYYRGRWRQWWSDCCGCDRTYASTRMMLWKRSSRAGDRCLMRRNGRRKRGTDEEGEVCRTCSARDHWLRARPQSVRRVVSLLRVRMTADGAGLTVRHDNASFRGSRGCC